MKNFLLYYFCLNDYSRVLKILLYNIMLLIQEFKKHLFCMIMIL